MNILIAPDSFKESMSAKEAARNIAAGFQSVSSSFRLRQLPLADGGEGTVDSVIHALNGEVISSTVSDPLGRQIEAEYGYLANEKTAIIEMASASGLPLLKKEEKNPAITTTYGTGELILDALNRGVEKVILGIGGSATNDGGLGMARALGARFYDNNMNELAGCGQDLIKLDRIDLSDMDIRVHQVDFEVACDVSNPLTGPNGAAFVYSPQKGADQNMVVKLDQGLNNYAEVIEKDLDVEVNDLPGAGAAGGLGAGLVAFLGAKLKPGVDIIFSILNIEKEIREADLVISGEGSCDRQSLMGKVIGGVAEICHNKNTPLIIVAGTIYGEQNNFYEKGVTALFSITTGPLTLQESIDQTEDLLKKTIINLARTIISFEKG
ncbi:MAG: glycerate kinase [Bacillota bacterium]